MLKRFEVKNFKSFKDNLIFDLSKTKNYAFNESCIKNGICNNAIIYGMNGSGKSNLGLAMFDIIRHASDSFSPHDLYANNYVYAGSKLNDRVVEFKYVFEFEKVEVVYSYSKISADHLVSENLTIGGDLFVDIDRSRTINKNKRTKAIINFKGTESLNKEIENDNLSILMYLKSNANLDKRTKVNKIFYQMINFIDGMLYFRSISDNRFIGTHVSNQKSIVLDIIEREKIEDFESFLNRVGIECKLIKHLNDICFDIEGVPVPFFDIASSGTKALALFYFWISRISEEKINFLFIDEFDAFYHYELSKEIVEMLKKQNIQILLTTHNTSIMTNDLMRPDCYFVIHNQQINSLPYLTEKELRFAHNLEKLYRANAFDSNDNDSE
ncbi:hypothetical protein ADP71_17100 [Vitreoscilla sp. C1]|uniref:AAA family ATPase n=1 Tax=Vitreoscilla sp. (strain C1) TaxID=96942 RepID=UPI00148EE871|nr:ATP-binding protein [Vitreoscilla sp. C1]AUZ05237.2 hypothetical protein ADP71_17100 [Vitreoscilla sp. C1]